MLSNKLMALFERGFGKHSKTNNAIEAWHIVFSSSFGTSKFNFILLFEKLKDEDEIIRQRLCRMENGEVFVRKKRYVELEENLKFFVEKTQDKYGLQ